MSEDVDLNQAHSNAASRIVQILFVLWLVFVNVFYYLQFRDLLLSLFGSWVHRWH
jgi:hypothetical protein